MVVELLEQLGREKEELAGLFVARHFDHLVVNGALGPRVHALVDSGKERLRGLATEREGW